MARGAVSSESPTAEAAGRNHAHDEPLWPAGTQGCTPPKQPFTKGTQILPWAAELAHELEAGLKLASDSFPFGGEGIELLQKASAKGLISQG